MTLSLYIDGNLIATLKVPKFQVNVMELIKELRSTHAVLIKQGIKHQFVLENVPSCMNEFHSLMEGSE